MFLQVEQFVKDKLPAILAGRERQNVLLASYRAIGNYPDGAVQTGDRNLSITVQTGMRDYSPAPVWLSGDSELGMRIAEMEAGAAMQSVRQRVSENLPALDTPLLVVVYLGLTAFDAAVVFTHKLKELYPAADMVTLTCDCDAMLKDNRLKPLVDSGKITYSLATGECGGMAGMETILKAIVAGWSVRSRSN